MSDEKKVYGHKLDPRPIPKGMTVAQMVDEHLFAYNAARLREACQLLARKVMQPDVTVGVTLSGALTPTGLGYSALVPLIDGGYIDWIISTGANLYHDIHRSLGFELFTNGAVGQNFNDYWRNDGVSWSLATNSVPTSIGAQFQGVTATPEPATVTLMVVGTALLAGATWRRKQQSKQG